ncbi:LegC2/C7 family Dot/Icm T4SS effector [Legionella sp. WA2022007384]
MATNAEELQHLIEIDTTQTKEIESAPTTLEEKIKSQLKILNEDTGQDKLQKITITKELFDEIKKSLQNTIQSMEKNPSIFSRAAEYWGELPLWQKIIGGVALTVPTLIIGIMAHVGFLLALCGVTAVTYAAGGVILDDHHKCSTSAVESLQKGILGLADLLELTISALEIIRKQLVVEIQKFAKENEILVANISDLSKQIDEIDKQVRATTNINTVLGETKDGLVAVSSVLKEGVAQHTDLMKQNQEKLVHFTEAYGATRKELSEKIEEIKKVKLDLEMELNKARSMVETLSSTISQLSNTVMGEDQRHAFQEKLDAFIEQKEGTFSGIATHMEQSGKQLGLVQKDLESTNHQYRELLKIQEQHLNALVTLKTQVPSEQTPNATPVSELLSTKGFYAPKQEKPGSEVTPTSSPEFN